MTTEIRIGNSPDVVLALADVAEAARAYLDEYDLCDVTGGGDPDHYTELLRRAVDDFERAARAE